MNTGAPPVIYNLRPASPHLTGREADLVALRQALAAGAAPALAALCGLAGVGKTSLALAYCHRQRADYALIGWLRAASATMLTSDLAGLAAALGGRREKEPPTVGADKFTLLSVLIGVYRRLRSAVEILIPSTTHISEFIRVHLWFQYSHRGGACPRPLRAGVAAS